MDQDKLKADLNNTVHGIASSFDMAELLNQNIWGAVVTTTRAYDKVSLKVDTNSNRIFISIQLKWWARFKKFDLIKKAWLARAEQRAKEQIPEGWKLLIYYEKESL